jgi:hypothetical protein
MQIDWQKTLDDILGITCPRCGLFTSQLFAGHSSEPWAVEYAPRCEDCTDKEGCESRKLIFLCQACARDLRLRVSPVDEPGMMTLLIEECRDDLEGCLTYLAEDWQEDLDIEPEDVQLGFEALAPTVFQAELESRARFENEYLKYHQWFRTHNVSIPDPGWRANYVEEIVGLGYVTALGD